MSAAAALRVPAVAGYGCVDAVGVRGTGGARGTWEQLGATAPGTGRTFRALFGRADPTFRRLDAASKALVLAAEAAGIAPAVPRAERDETALVVETERGCLEPDVRFQLGLERGVVEGAVFPYTLPSASLGEVALRHGLRGPALCLSITATQRGEALREAARLLRSGEARHAVAARVEALTTPRAGLTPALHAVVVLLSIAGRPCECAPVDDAWLSAPGDAFTLLAAALDG